MSEQRQRRAKPAQNQPLQVQATASPREWTQSEQNEMEIDLIDLAYSLLAGWKLIVCLCLVGAIAAGLFTAYAVTPQYKATAIIYVLGNSDSAINLSDLQIGNALTKDYVKVFKMWEVHEEVITNLNLPYSYQQMRNMLSVANESDTRMIDITITSPSPEEAAAIANEYAKVASQFIAETMSTDKPNIMSVALVPSNPSSPSLPKNVVMGFLLGAVLSCGYLVIRFIMDDKYKTTEDILKYTGMTNLAVIYDESAEQKQNARRHA